jgi:hypothetical protein
MDAPEIGPANIASSATVAPMAIPAVIPFSFEPLETARITSFRIAVRIYSRTYDCPAEPAGMVAPSVALLGNSAYTVSDAANAPAHCAAMYGARSRLESRPAAQNAIDTAGFKCAPETSPKVEIIAITMSPNVSATPT